MKKTLFIAMFYFLFGATFSAVADQGNKPYVGSKAFERMKQLAGNWEATMDMGKGPQTVKASYKLTSAGSALIETVFEGAPHEMVSVYHDNKNGKLTMTHYWAEHNQPKLVLAGMNNNTLTMDLASDSDVDVAKEMHIHSIAIQFEGADKMTQLWTSFAGGKKAMVVTMVFNRVK